jgi:hypothetical protein
MRDSLAKLGALTPPFFTPFTAPPAASSRLAWHFSPFSSSYLGMNANVTAMDCMHAWGGRERRSKSVVIDRS